MICLAPAKINLFLHVVGRRDDGYHLLQTVFRFLDFGDSLSIETRDDGRITRVCANAELPDDDLCTRAARLLKTASGTRLGAHIELEKRLPIGGGLGGGSSDAASVLLCLNRLWGLDWSRERLAVLAIQLGADVPVFVFGRSAFAEGVGEVLTAIELEPAWYLVLTPPVAVATASVFAAPELTRNTIPVKIRDFSVRAGHNDLEPVVRRQYPIVAQYLDWLAGFGVARMSGSGSSVFAEFATRGAAEAVFAQRPAGYDGFVARGIDAHPFYTDASLGV